MTPIGFPHSDISGSMFARQFPGAFLSKPRPSSPTDAKASTVCPLQLGFDEDAYARYVVVKEPGHEKDFCSLRTARAGVRAQRVLYTGPSISALQASRPEGF